MNDPILTGYIHSFESFGTVDGPGIRTVVFMQGCRFRCLYCHNPDTWAESGGTPITTDELVKRIIRYKSYFESSGGGVTVSGGEPLLQAPFVSQLFRQLKKEGIHTCLDTNGHYPEEQDPKVLEELLTFTDLVLLDVKHIDPINHKALTGHSNEATFFFARLLKDKQIPVWMRYVVVPGYTDSPGDIMKIKELASLYPNVGKLEFLPFHQMGAYKWDALGLSYPLKSVQPPVEEFMKSLSTP